MNVLGAFIQVIAAIVILILINKGMNKILRSERIVVDYSAKVYTKIFSGWVSTASFTNRTYNTFNPFATTYRHLPRSVNRLGGAQFTFSIWTRFDDTSTTNLMNKVVFLYGDPTEYTVTKEIESRIEETVTDYVIKCPLVKFSADGESIIVEFNTNDALTNRAIIPKIRTTDDAKRHNVVAMLPGKWALWTFVFEDNVSHEVGVETGAQFRMYINDFLHHTQRYNGSLRVNRGYINMLPVPINNAFLADFSYFNYALNANDITKIVGKGINQNIYNEMDSDASFTEPNYITEYNKLEIYNM
jgi:hypothetical protein